MEVNKVDKFEPFYIAFKESFGSISKACEAVDVSRTTFYNWINDHQEFADKIEALRESFIDHVESKLFEKVNGVTIGKVIDGELKVYDQPPSDNAILFYLKTKGKKRGYIERTEQEITLQKPIILNWSDEPTGDNGDKTNTETKRS
jgi:hypothetical protein